jgi:citronellol/citronellal dehydrogenase
VVLISGAGSGIGRVTAFELAALGATVIGCGRRIEPLEEAAALAREAGGAFEAVACDIRDEDAVAAMVAGICERHGRVDTLVNNAGGQFLSPAEANAPGADVRGGKVVAITLSPHNGMPGMVHSGAARAAVENMMKTLSIEWARFGIRLNAIAPGQIATHTLKTKYPAKMVDTMETTIPLGRLGEPEEVAWLIAYLASPAGDFFSGATITVDGARDNWFGSWPPEIGQEDGKPLAERRRPKP